jgi:Neprosin
MVLAPPVAAGRLVIAYNGMLLGYYPGRLFTQLDKGACSANWYVEVADQTPGTTWAKTEMGSGKFVEDAGRGEAASVRQPLYLDESWGVREVGVDERMSPEEKLCYTRSALLDLGPVLGKQFRAGGPGGYNPLCTKAP